MWQQYIAKEFKLLLEKIETEEGFQCKKYKSRIRDTNSILELSGYIDCLLYFKIRSAAPYRWGITKNRIEEIENSHKKWFVALLYETPDNGYLLSSDEVRSYIRKGLWPLGRGRNRNEYKIRPGTPLQYNQPFNKFSKFMKLLKSKTT